MYSLRVVSVVASLDFCSPALQSIPIFSGLNFHWRPRSDGTETCRPVNSVNPLQKPNLFNFGSESDHLCSSELPRLVGICLFPSLLFVKALTLWRVCPKGPQCCAIVAKRFLRLPCINYQKFPWWWLWSFGWGSIFWWEWVLSEATNKNVWFHLPHLLYPFASATNPFLGTWVLLQRWTLLDSWCGSCLPWDTLDSTAPSVAFALFFYFSAPSCRWAPKWLSCWGCSRVGEA